LISLPKRPQQSKEKSLRVSTEKEAFMKSGRFAARVAALFLALTPLVKADLVSSLGDTAPPFANGSHPTAGAVLLAQAGSPLPFLGTCGADLVSNCAATWTFSYTVPSGQTVSGANLTLGIADIDSAALGNQVGSYTLGATDLTAALNIVAEGLNGGTGATNSEYDVLTITIPSAAFATLQTGSGTVSLALQAPGLGILGATNFNGAGLLFSTLDIQTSAATVPEPAALPLLLAAVGALGLLRLRRKPNRES
jgi:hypothetical protein